MDQKEFARNIHREASKWRHERLKELIEKERDGTITEFEKYFIKQLAEIHGNNF